MTGTADSPRSPAPPAEPRHAVGRLIRDGRNGDAVAYADKLLGELTDPHEIGGVLLSKLAALLNQNLMRQCPPVIDALWVRLQLPGADASQVAEFHGLAADTAFRQGSIERCVSHLLRGSRALEQLPPGRAAIRAWVTTATAYSYVGFHRQGMAALDRAQAMVDHGNEDDRKVVMQPEIPVRQAVYLDQQGESEAAQLALADLIGRLRADDVTVVEQPYLGYALARHLALGGRLQDTPGAEDPHALLSRGLDSVPENVELRHLGEATLAIVEGRCREALEMLVDAVVTHTRLGTAEVPRLRTLAYKKLGDYASAYEAQCEVTSMLARAANGLYDLFIDGVTARLDYDELLRNVSRYADEAHTDPLTGLPNRRRLEHHTAELLARGGSGVIGVADIDRFKDVNTVHGHLVGDQVLRQVAAILSRTLRTTDFLARFAGDEFVIVLPNTELAEAEDIAKRLTAAVAAHHWQAAVPGNPVSLTVGLARLESDASLAEAFEAADLLMLEAKGRRPD